MIFSGTPLQQAQILLREVKEKGVIANDSTIIPSPLNSVIGDTVCFAIAGIGAYAANPNISLNKLGFLNDSDSESIKPKVNVDYFVIHDAKTPY